MDLAADEQFWAAECLNLGWMGLDDSPGRFLHGLCNEVPKRQSETLSEFVRHNLSWLRCLGSSVAQIKILLKKKHFFFSIFCNVKSDSEDQLVES